MTSKQAVMELRKTANKLSLNG